MIAVPDSGNAAARGYARASGLPQDDGFVKNRYVARTFIQPGQELRKHGLRMKFNPLPDVVAGLRLVVVDDSIVRGNTTRQIVQMLRDAGASEVHMRISAPPIRNPCHYGIDMSTREEMIAHDRTEAEVAAELGADSLAYLSLAGVYEAIRGTRSTHCDACFSGDYPLANTGETQTKDAVSSSRSSGQRLDAAAPTSSRKRVEDGQVGVDVRLLVRERHRGAGAGDRLPDAAVGHEQPARVDQPRRRASAPRRPRCAAARARGSSPSARRGGARARAARAARRRPRSRRRAGRRARRSARRPRASGRA